MMPDPDRSALMRLDADRKAARAQLTTDVTQAKLDLHPRTMMQRWTGKQKRNLATKASESAEFARRNAHWFGLAGAAIMLYAARNPILNFYRKLRDPAPETEEQTP